ncbi:MAG: hypothetical protein A3J37_03000 [Alphaproteobacteria bacterium RIFCSPHIGHO2_12_FULL_45_9]|nr:MAG: hypothetical protein A3B66_10085 [Alphaproteobacteria bacterium RIFCSPHIGHO2_02_FULL_46_13]OFW95984.1 MAG: hypothetical protein A3J37_03000 [Alphaproteobacteria bacterium RIFCSPHIGHO2_12_FULL_45_9]
MNSSKTALESELSSDQLISLGKSLPLNCLSEIFDKIVPSYHTRVEALIILVSSPLYAVVSESEPVATALYLCEEIAKLGDAQEIGRFPKPHPLLVEQYRLLELVEEKRKSLQKAFQARNGSSSEGYSNGLSCQLKTLDGILGDLHLTNTSVQALQLIPN